MNSLTNKLTKLCLEESNEELSLEEVNTRIKNEIRQNTIDTLSDENLLKDYQECISVQNKIKIIDVILEKYIEKETKDKIIKEYLLQLIPPGTKGVVRGRKFNDIVKTHINSMNLDKERFEICFEKICEHNPTSEIPDWYILEKTTKKNIIGMNQTSLWGGGQQLNRGSKYITDYKHNNENAKLLCVVCNKVQIKNKNNKTFKIFQTGFKYNTLCYLNNLKNIIINFFK